ncbi:hypothetical protein FGU71_05225 [Erythrobacter insulae]|uniref:Cytochrome c domain-containing protein n=1 Tax=Erythrobacter insulae TaxID=2584124 RepID=A0A547PAX9_9SPHN|nr:hypothetical protein [Erythrobacter insulae]TRD11306.1 hypothetical protein FGU71_05225 [Erythrobacter insulae]
MMNPTIARFIALTGCVFLVPACQTGMRPQLPASAQTPPSLIAGVCGDCHAVEEPFESPNPKAPTFASIANREGLTRETLAPWLLDAHNYPEQMDFELSPGEAKQIADYMLTLQSEDYRPQP